MGPMINRCNPEHFYSFVEIEERKYPKQHNETMQKFKDISLGQCSKGCKRYYFTSKQDMLRHNHWVHSWLESRDMEFSSSLYVSTDTFHIYTHFLLLLEPLGSRSKVMAPNESPYMISYMCTIQN